MKRSAVAKGSRFITEEQTNFGSFLESPTTETLDATTMEKFQCLSLITQTLLLGTLAGSSIIKLDLLEFLAQFTDNKKEIDQILKKI